MLGANFAIFRQIPPGLAHHPHWDSRKRLAPAGAQEQFFSGQSSGCDAHIGAAERITNPSDARRRVTSHGFACASRSRAGLYSKLLKIQRNSRGRTERLAYLHFLYAGKSLAGRSGTVLLVAGMVAHYFALLERSRGLHTVPYHDLYGSMSLFGWLLALTYLGLEFYHRQRTVGAFVLPFVLVFFAAAHLAPPNRLAPAPLHGRVFAFHVTLSILAYAA